LIASNFQKSREGEKVKEEFHELYLHEVFKGKPEIGFVGLYPLFREFMKIKDYSIDQQIEINMYLDFLMGRAKGEVKTDAKFIRDFIQNHEKYEKNSYVCDVVMRDLLKMIDTMSRDDYALNLFQVNK